MPDPDEGNSQGDGDEGGRQGGNQSDDPGQFDLDWEIRRRDPGGLTRKAAPGSDEGATNSDEPEPDPDDPGEFELVELVEGKRREPKL